MHTDSKPLQDRNCLAGEQAPSQLISEPGSNSPIAEDLQFQYREWIIQRVAWGVWVLVLLAAVLGLFGSGYFSSVTLSSINGDLVVKYARFEHMTAPTSLTLVLSSLVADETEMIIWIDRSWWQDIQVTRIQPEPSQSQLSHNAIGLHFRKQRGVMEASVQIHFSYSVCGSKTAIVHVKRAGGDLSHVEFSQFVYP